MHTTTAAHTHSPLALALGIIAILALTPVLIMHVRASLRSYDNEEQA